MGIGTSAPVENDARDAARGDAVHASIAVVALRRISKVPKT